MAVLPKLKDKIMDVSKNEQTFTPRKTLHGIILLNKNKIESYDGSILGVSIDDDAITIKNLGVIGKTTTDNFTTNYLEINSVVIPDIADKTEEKIDKVLIYKNKDKWVYENIDAYIENKINQHLSDNYNSIPTGSIQWCPKSLEEYKSLKEDNPLKTDYLLCDGRKYKIKDYQNLYNVLKNRKIIRHVKHTTNNETVFYYPTLIENNDDTYFYVPDLRHMFLSNTQVSTSDELFSPDSGVYTPDNRGTNERLDQKPHRHFITYGTWYAPPFGDYPSNIDRCNWYPNTYYFEHQWTKIDDSGNYKPTQPTIDTKQAYDNNDFTLLDGAKIGIIPLNNHAYTYYQNGMIGFGSNTNSNERIIKSVPANIFFMRPTSQTSNYKDEFVGLSSYAVNSFIQEPTTEDYSIISKGHENYCDFYAMLPLIKI